MRRNSSVSVQNTHALQGEQREREQLAQTVHDVLQQLLYAASMEVSLLKNRAHDETTKGDLTHIDALLDESITITKSIHSRLRAPIGGFAGA